MENDHVYQLVNDIDATGFKWRPYSFSGILYGNGFIVSNLVIVIENESKDLQQVGLFKELNGKIDGLGLVDAYISVKTPGNVYLGGLVGNNLGFIENSFVSGASILANVSNYSTIGGLVGYGNNINDSYFINSSITLTPIGEGDSMISIGGLAGSGSEINNSYMVNSSIVVDSKIGKYSLYVGGLVGSGSNINSSYVKDSSVIFESISKNSANIGGLTGSGENINNSYVVDLLINVVAIIEEQAQVNIGGLVGYGKNINDSYTKESSLLLDITIEKINAHGQPYIGGLIGYGENIIGSYVIDTLITVNLTNIEMRLGGLAGSGNNITNSYVEKTSLNAINKDGGLTAVTIGGLVANGGNINNSYVSAVTIVNDNISISVIGGLGGNANDINNTYVINSSITTNSSTSDVGGLVGNSEGYIKNSYVSNMTILIDQEIESNMFIGGLVGHSSPSSDIYSSFIIGIKITFNTSNISRIWLGALAGEFYYDRELKDTYVSDDVKITKNDVTMNINTISRVPVIKNSLFDNKDFYINTLKWSDSVWNLENLDYKNNQYPTLRN